MSESVILCEGFHDRAFWKGWLLYLGCSEARGELDPWGKPVPPKQFAYRTPSERYVRVKPCDGKDNIRREGRLRLNRRTNEPITRLVLCGDEDVNADGTGDQTIPFSQQNLLDLAREFDPSAQAVQDGDVALDENRTRISSVLWRAQDPPNLGLPNQQTLERLASAALTSVYPARAQAVQQWLDSRPSAPVAGPKEYGWSYMAGWFARFNCEAFYTELWRDEQMVAELRSRLQAVGAWRVAEILSE